jgi:hypothetical protein
MKIACCAARISAFGFVSAAGAATCESTPSLDLPNTEVTLAAQVATGAFRAPDQEGTHRESCYCTFDPGVLACSGGDGAACLPRHAPTDALSDISNS